MLNLLRIITMLSLIAATGSGCDDDPPPDGDGDVDGDADGDADGDGDGDSDGDADGDLDGACREDEDCADESFCNGAERCIDGECIAGEPVECDDGDDCTTDSCNERVGDCAFVIRDRDEDMFGDAECGGADCDDTNPAINPDADEQVCNGADDDCDGLVDEPVPQRITDAVGYSWGPSLIWNGSVLGLSWRDDFESEPEIHFLTLSQELEPQMEPIVVSETEQARKPSMVWTGSEFGIAWEEVLEEARYEISFARVTPEGDVASATTLTDAEFFSRSPSLAWSGEGYAVAWNDSRPREELFHPFFARISAGGDKMGDDLQLSAEDADVFTSPSLVWDGSSYVAVWSQPSGIDTTLWFARISADGELEVEPRRILEISGDVSANPRLAACDDGFGLIWADSREVSFAHLDSDGAISGSITLVEAVSDAGSPPSIVWNGSELGLAWSDMRNGESEVYFTRVTAGGVELMDEQINVSHSVEHAVLPSLTWTGSEYVVAWADYRYFDNEIMMARLCME